ncbi:putative transmembrane protein [Bacteroides heparinolyticus]|uniref:Putative transmembrane protein n=1 Tax=Prevotella heparinolytica TaxID=28113 RepID=A0A449I765_9BACE|nr:putative transmembrane protein [Bacteroides heparinolyticus]
MFISCIGKQDSPIVELENTIAPICIVETPPIEQPIDLPEQEYLPTQESDSDIVNSDTPKDSHLNKYDSILVELKKREIERQVEIMDAIREYVTVKTAPYLSKENIATLISNIEFMAYDQPDSYKPIRSNIDNPLRSPGLRHLAWNVGERLGIPLAKRAAFIKASFPYELVNATHEYLRLNLRDHVTS